MARHSGPYILTGAKPAELPVRAEIQVEFNVNGSILEITRPRGLSLAAGEVIR